MLLLNYEFVDHSILTTKIKKISVPIDLIMYTHNNPFMYMDLTFSKVKLTQYKKVAPNTLRFTY